MADPVFKVPGRYKVKATGQEITDADPVAPGVQFKTGNGMSTYGEGLLDTVSDPTDPTNSALVSLGGPDGGDPTAAAKAWAEQVYGPADSKGLVYVNRTTGDKYKGGVSLDDIVKTKTQQFAADQSSGKAAEAYNASRPVKTEPPNAASFGIGVPEPALVTRPTNYSSLLRSTYAPGQAGANITSTRPTASQYLAANAARIRGTVAPDTLGNRLFEKGYDPTSGTYFRNYDPAAGKFVGGYGMDKKGNYVAKDAEGLTAGENTLNKQAMMSAGTETTLTKANRTDPTSRLTGPADPQIQAFSKQPVKPRYF